MIVDGRYKIAAAFYSYKIGEIVASIFHPPVNSSDKTNLRFHSKSVLSALLNRNMGNGVRG
jgi:hypothetical protein